MRILFVVNSYFSQGNGLDESARRTVEALRAAGQEVRVLSGKNFENPDGPQPVKPNGKRFHRRMLKNNFPHTFIELHGKHNWTMWQQCLREFVIRNF